MRVKRQGLKFYVGQNGTTEYPVLSIAVAVVLLYLSPFITSWLAVVPFVICLYRMFRYNARVFATDYCLLMPISALTKAGGGVALLIYLCLLAGIWYLIRGGFRANAPYVLLIILANYLLLRMQMNINDFVLCFGQMFVLCALLPEQDDASAERAIKAFCTSLIVSSIYAFALRNTAALRVITGAASSAFRGTKIRRFNGLFADPNYYMTYLTVGIALLMKLKHSGRIRPLRFWFQAGCMTLFGILTYSKMFFLMFVLLVGVYVLWQYWNRKVLRGFAFTIVAVAAMTILITMENSPFAMVLERFSSARNISELTTSRTDLFALYMREITSSIPSFLFGKGLAAEALYRDPHNLYLEVAYYIGCFGLLLFLAFYLSMIRVMAQRSVYASKQKFLEKYLIFVVVAGLYLSLHGMFSQVLYGELFLANLSVLMVPRTEEGMVKHR